MVGHHRRLNQMHPDRSSELFFDWLNIGGQINRDSFKEWGMTKNSVGSNLNDFHKWGFLMCNFMVQKSNN